MTRPSTVSWTAGLAASLYSGLALWRPSFWTDEAATLSAVRRSLLDLVSMLGSIDAVHGVYYFLMFGWVRLFGFSEVAMRLPSLIAVSLSAFLMVELGRKLHNVRFGAVAAFLLVVMPRTQYVATDARSYALTVLGAVSATYLLIWIRENPRPARWALYAVIGAVSVGLSFYLVLLFVAHAITLMLDDKLRPSWRGLLAASLGWVVPALFIGIAASKQQFQISWIPPVAPSFVFEFSFLQFFADGYFVSDGRVAPEPTPGESFSMTALAILFWTAAAAGLFLWRRNRFMVQLALPWLLVPATVVIGGSLLTGGNYYLPRYLTFELPALALLAAAAPATFLFSSRGVRTAKTAVVLGTLTSLILALPSYVGQRTQFGRDRQDDFRFIAESVENMSRPDAAFVVSPAQSLVLQAYPDSFKGLGDPTRGISAAQWQRIFDQRFDITSSAPGVSQYPTVILVERNNESVMSNELRQLGYERQESLIGPATTVSRYRK